MQMHTIIEKICTAAWHLMNCREAGLRLVS